VRDVHAPGCCHTMTLMSVASAVIDADSHLSEPRTMWADHADPADRHLALHIGDDDLGHAWLMRGDRRIHIAEVHRSGDPPAKGRVHPVAHLSLRDLDWLDAQLAFLSANGIRLAMIAPALVDGKPLSHPDLDRAWNAFVHHGITPVFHVSAFPHPFHDEWYDDDNPDDVAPVLSSVFLWTAPALALADLAIHGVFARLPDLRLGIMELSAVWVPMYLLMLDGGFAFHER